MMEERTFYAYEMTDGDIYIVCSVCRDQGHRPPGEIEALHFATGGVECDLCGVAEFPDPGDEADYRYELWRDRQMMDDDE